MCTRQPCVPGGAVAAERCVEAGRYIDPVVVEGRTWFCSCHNKSLDGIVVVAAVFVHDTGNTSFHLLPAATVEADRLWDSICQCER